MYCVGLIISSTAINMYSHNHISVVIIDFIDIYLIRKSMMQIVEKIGCQVLATFLIFNYCIIQYIRLMACIA